MIDKYLPVGSVVLLDGGEKRVMIIGRGGRDEQSGVTWDYLACPYPEGYIGDDFAYVFDHGQIERVFFLGFQDEEELALRQVMVEVSAESAADDPEMLSGSAPV